MTAPLRRSSRRPFPALPALDVVLATASLYAALLIRFEGDIEERFARTFPWVVGPVAFIKIALFFGFGLYAVQWKYASVRDLLRLGAAAGASTVLSAGASVFLQLGGYPQAMPRSVLVIDLLLFTALAGGLRLIPRFLAHAPARTAGRKPALIYGAGAGGEKIARNMAQHPEYPYFPVGFLDDDPAKRGTTIHGVKVLGGGADLAEIAVRTAAEALIVAIPSARGPQIRAIAERARQARIPDVKVLPPLEQILDVGEITVNQVRKIEVADLMGREPVTIDTASIEAHLRGKRVLVTGAAGSIGSELVRQILRFAPEKVCLFDHDETELFYLQAALAKEAPRLEVQVADVRDASRVDAVFRAFRPQAVFHAAAYKHVPMIEPHPEEAVRTNAFGTRNLSRAAREAGCESFVLISTDKAVNPTSVMGATKRVAEMILRETGRGAPGRFAAVRFGNVLGSRGSVVLTFREQIARGGPVTITHPEMKRYFMIVAEACLLVLQAAALARGGEVFVLDMGEPVRIVDLAREMIRLSGLEPEIDIPISYTGVRPGEKLFEEYLTAEEGVDATRHQKIFVARITHDLGGDALGSRLEDLELACDAQDVGRVRTLLAGIVTTYRPATA